MVISRAYPTEAKALTDLTLSSKAYWGYSPEQLKDWRDELTITDNFITDNELFTIKSKEQLIGFYAYVPIDRRVVKLHSLFVSPTNIGTGIGHRLLSHFLEKVTKGSWDKVVLDADPNAKGFYEKYGFTQVGRLPSSIKDRYLPIMEKQLVKKT